MRNHWNIFTISMEKKQQRFGISSRLFQQKIKETHDTVYKNFKNAFQRRKTYMHLLN